MTAKQKELINSYEEAIEVCERWRSKRPLPTATPAELHLYNVFTIARRDLAGELAVIRDVVQR
jgi:hypothetical protein